MDGDNQKLGQDGGPAVPHSPLSPDEPVSLRLPESPAQEATAGYPGPAQPLAAVAGPALPAAPAVSPEPVEPAAASEASQTQTAYQPTTAQPVSAYALDGPEAADEEPEPENDTELEWTAAEFIAHPKGIGWYAALVAVTAVVVVLAYLIAHDYVTVAVIIICAALFGYAAGREPRELQYALSTTGIAIGPKFYPYKDFSSFAIVPEGVTSSIDFMPLKRFAPILSISYDPAHDPGVMDILSQHLPVTHHKRTMIDDFMHRIHF